MLTCVFGSRCHFIVFSLNESDTDACGCSGESVHQQGWKIPVQVITEFRCMSLLFFKCYFNSTAVWSQRLHFYNATLATTLQITVILLWEKNVIDSAFLLKKKQKKQLNTIFKLAFGECRIYTFLCTYTYQKFLVACFFVFFFLNLNCD